MKIDFTGRGVEITSRLRDFTEGKLERVKKLVEDMHDITVVLSTEKYRHKADIRFLSQKRSYQGAWETSDMFQAIDHVVAKLESQVKKFKNKQRSLKRSTTESIRGEGLQATEDPAAPIDGEVRIIRSSNSQVKPMNVDEAVDELQKFKREFVFFRNADNDAVNVVYNRKDGHIGLIEPAG